MSVSASCKDLYPYPHPVLPYTHPWRAIYIHPNTAVVRPASAPLPYSQALQHRSINRMRKLKEYRLPLARELERIESSSEMDILCDQMKQLRVTPIKKMPHLEEPALSNSTAKPRLRIKKMLYLRTIDPSRMCSNT